MWEIWVDNQRIQKILENVNIKKKLIQPPPLLVISPSH